MRIESLAQSPDRAGRYWVKFSDGTSIGLYRQTIEDFGLYPSLELTDTQLDALREAAGRMSAKMRAVRIVSASSVSKKDLHQRLINKGENPEQAREAVEWMQELNLLDDAETARQIVGRCIARGYGLSRAKQMLYEKKIPKNLWNAALEGYPDQSEHILSFLRSRLSGNSDPKETKRAVDALLRRGHSYSVIRRCLSRLNVDTDDFLEE